MMDHVILGLQELSGNEFALSREDRMRHLYVVGQTGTGKTTLIHNLLIQDIEAGLGVMLVDPHGELSHGILDHIPKRRIEDVVYFDPADPECAVSFNLFARVPPDRRHLVAAGIVGAFKGIFPEFFGPRMEYVFYAAVSALLECENVSLLSLQRMLSDGEYRAWVVNHVKDPVVRSFWEDEFEANDRKTKAEIVSPILNKIGPILMAPQLRCVLGQVRTRIDARRIMDRGQIFIANLSKGRIGEQAANLLGSFLVGHFQVAAMSRADVPEECRRDFMLYADEFHSFVTDSFATILSEARKYRLGLTISHQYLSQVKPKILEAVLGNVGSIVAFRVGYDDAEVLERAYGKAYVASQFTGLGNREVLVKLLSDGRQVEPFTGRTLPPIVRRNRGGMRRDTIIARSRARHSVPRPTVERQIGLWFEKRRR